MEFIYFTALSLLTVLSYYSSKVLAPTLIWIVSKFVAKTKSTLDDRIFSEVKSPIESSFLLFVFYIGVKILPFYATSEHIVDKYANAAVILLSSYLIVRIAKAVFHWYYEEGHKTSRVKVDLSLMPLLMKLTELIVLSLAVTLILSEMGYSITAIFITFTSLVGIIVGLACQETLANVFAGIALQMDRPVNYGDYLKFPTGEIARLRKIGMRSSRLFDLSGNQILVSNSEFAKMRVTKIGSPNAFNLPVPFESPIEIRDDEIAEYVKSALVKESIEGVKDASNIYSRSLKVKSFGFYEGVIKVPVTDIHDYTQLIDRVNELILEVIKKKSRNIGRTNVGHDI